MTPLPTDPYSYNHTFVVFKREEGQRSYHLIDQPAENWVSKGGPEDEPPTLLLCHGYPDLWYGYRYQIADFSKRGWRVIVPSQLGYGHTSKPANVEAYSYKSVAYDMNSILDELNVKKPVVVIGHDWGGTVAWRFADFFPHRVKAIACICTPYPVPATTKTPDLPDAEFIRKYLPNFGYQLYFQQPKTPAEMGEVIEHFLAPCHSPTFRRLPAKEKPAGSEMGSWVKEGKLEASIKRQIEGKRNGTLAPPPNDPELNYYVKMYRQGGLEGPLNWYKTRAVNRREEIEAKLPPFPAHIPALQLPAVLDAALPPSMAKAPSVLKCFPGGNLEIRELPGADHWCLEDEKTRDGVTKILGDWIEHVLAGKWKPAPVEARL